MSQITEVNNQILSKILKTDEFYEALWGKEDFTPEATITEPNDYNCGALANPLEYVYQFIRDITGQDLDDLDEPYIDIVVFFFTGFKRYQGEGNADLIRRMESLLIREADWRSERFGTPWDIKNVFSYYLDRELLYYIPNTVLTDLLINGDLELVIAGEWVFNPGGDRLVGDAFTGSYKLDFTAFTDVTQTLSVTSGSFILNCFAKPISGTPGDIMSISSQRDSDSRYFNTTDLVWQVADPVNTFTSVSGDWELATAFVIIDGSYDIDIKFTKIVDILLDHIEFGEKLYPAYELLFVDSGLATGSATVWGVSINYVTASFTDQDFMFASAASNYSDSYYQSLIEMVTGSGIKGIFNRETRS